MSRSASAVYSREGLLNLIDSLPLAVAVIDQNRSVILANRMTCRFTNKNEAQLIGRVGGEALGCCNHASAPGGCGFGPVCLKCKLRQTVMDTMEQQTPHEMVETSMVFKGRGQTHIRISTLPITLGGEEVVLLSIEDITEVKNHEKVLLEKEKLAAVLKTTGAVCHEINQPLMVILGLSEILMEDLGDSNVDTRNLEELKKQARRLGDITKKLTSITQYRTKPYLQGEIIDIDAASGTGKAPENE